TATVGDLRELGSAVLSFHGQHEHRKLGLAAFQMDVLDGAVGADQIGLRDQAAEAHQRVREASAHLESLSGDGGAYQREVDLLRYEVEEIERLAPSAAEMDSLRSERERLRRIDGLRDALSALSGLNNSDAGDSPLDSLGAAGRLFETVAGVDGAVDALGSRLSELGIELDDASREARSLLDGLDGSPERLGEVEERLDELERLLRKHGGSIEAVLAHAEVSAARLEEISDLDQAVSRAKKASDEALAAATAVAVKLRAGRMKAAKQLAPAVEEVLGDLALEGARFRISVDPRTEPGPTGGDTVEFLVSANAGIDPAPISESASGGEMSRILLALLSVAIEGGEGSPGKLVVFDEIDAGIGGRTAKAVGERLKALACQRQVLCITHLPQVAAGADRNFRISKGLTDGESVTTVDALVGDEVLEEMVRMLGAPDGDEAALAHARELLAGA
ncbi:MAG: DNA repair protein RecN, partial [Actinomycetes bacterium]